eukprot:jgi/Tetstr1/457430/TSEL_004214.t1
MRKGLTASQVENVPPGDSTYSLADLMVKALDLAERLRDELDNSWGGQAREAIIHIEPMAKWTSDTASSAWLQRVSHEVGEQPPDGFPWTPHSLQKGVAPAAYASGVVMQKIKHFCGWAVLSNVALDYIDPAALPCAAFWQFFGWSARPGWQMRPSPA